MGIAQWVEGKIPFSSGEGDPYKGCNSSYHNLHDECFSITQVFVS